MKNLISAFLILFLLLTVACKSNEKKPPNPTSDSEVATAETNVEATQEITNEACKQSSPVYYELVEFLEKDNLTGIMRKDNKTHKLKNGTAIPVQFQIDYKSRMPIEGMKTHTELALWSFCLNSAEEAKTTRDQIDKDLKKNKRKGFAVNHNHFVLYILSLNKESDEHSLSYKARIEELAEVMD